MTPTELIADLHKCGSQDLSVTLYFIAERLVDSTLESGAGIHDRLDFERFLLQCAKAAKKVTT